MAAVLAVQEETSVKKMRKNEKTIEKMSNIILILINNTK